MGWSKPLGLFAVLVLGVVVFVATNCVNGQGMAPPRIGGPDGPTANNAPPRMKAAIGGDPGRLAGAEVSEVWAKGEVVITFLRPGDGANRVLLKGADTTLVADGYRFYS